VKSLQNRFTKEADNLSDLTGWTAETIKTRMDRDGKTAAAIP